MSAERIAIAFNLTNVISLLTIAGSCTWFIAIQSQQTRNNSISIENIDNRLHQAEGSLYGIRNDISWIRAHIETEHSSK
jgi:hypothetical protein